MNTSPPSLPRAPRHKSGRKVYFLIGVVTCAIIGLAGAGLWLYLEMLSDDAARYRAERVALEESLLAAGYPVTEAAWNEKFPPVTDAENGALLYEQAFIAMRALPPEHDLIVPHVGKMDPPEGDQFYSPESVAAIHAHLEANRGALELAIEAAALPRVTFSSYGYVEGGLSTYSRVADLRNLILLELDHAASEGDAARIERALLALHSIAQALDESPYQFDGIIGLSMRRNFYQASTILFSRTKASAELFAHLAKPQWRIPDRTAEINIIARVPDYSLMPDDVVSMFFLIDDKRLLLPFPDSVKTRWVDDIVEGHRLVDLGYRAVLLDLLEGPAKETKAAAERAKADFESKASKALSVAGQPLALDGFWSLRAHEALFETTLAVERYRMETGVLPERLDALAPDSLGAIPVDPYDGEPIRYTRKDKGYIVYSVGENLKDDGGVTFRKRTEQETLGDVVFVVAR